MSTKERVTELLKELREDLTQLGGGTESIPNPVEKLVAATKAAFNKLDDGFSMCLTRANFSFDMLLIKFSSDS